MPSTSHRSSPPHRSPSAVLRRALAGGVAALGVALLTASPAAAVDAQSVSDAQATRVVLLVVAGFVVLGVVLAGVTVWFWRTTRPEHPVLAPLEVMGARRFDELSTFEQQLRLDAVRPPTSAPPTDDVGSNALDDLLAAIDLESAPPESVDAFDDLHAVSSETPSMSAVAEVEDGAVAAEPAAEAVVVSAEPAVEAVVVSAEPAAEPAVASTPSPSAVLPPPFPAPEPPDRSAG